MGTPSPQRPVTIFASIVFLILLAIFLILLPSLYIGSYKQFFFFSQVKSSISPTQQSTFSSAQNGQNPISHTKFPTDAGFQNEENPVSGSGNGTSNDAKEESQSTDETSSETDPVAAADDEFLVLDKETLADDGRARVANNEETLADEGMRRCDLYRGRWVEEQEYPLYEPGSCPYVDEGFNCQNNGRSDSNYTRWQWKPDGCDLPKFNATDFLSRLRGKRLMLVGDSMNRNQFESMLCLLREGLSDKSRMYEAKGHKITKGRGYFAFKFVDYNCTVEFVRSHFLVKEGIRINDEGNSNPTLSIDVIDKTAKKWRKADIVVFNTGHWWVHGKTARGVKYYKEGDYLYPKFDAVEAYRRALRTWAKWVDENMNPGKQMVFYRGYSSAHFSGGDWDSGGSCTGETQPVRKGAILENYPLKMKIVEEVIREMNFPVVLLNVTRLTNFRKDGHPSIFGKRGSSRKQDCSHWCLPGVPDVWNELIYASLVFQQTNYNN